LLQSLSGPVNGLENVRCFKQEVTSSPFHKLLIISFISWNIVCFPLGNSPASEFYMPIFRNTLSVPPSQAGRYEDGTDSVLKRWHIKFRRRGITQRKAYNIQNRAKVWNQELLKYVLTIVQGDSNVQHIQNVLKPFFLIV
jgi:hypothetical protein